MFIYYNRRKLSSQTSDNMQRWKSRGGQSQRGEVKSQKKEDAGARFTMFLQWFVAPEGRKITSLKRRVRNQLARWEIKKLYAVVARSTFPSQNVQCTKHANVGPLLEVKLSQKCTLLWREARFQDKNAQNTPRSDHFWTLRCLKSARCCGAKHICKSKCTKHTMLRPLLEVEMSKKCTPLWCEAHFQVKSVKTRRIRTTFWRSDVEKVHAVVARSTFPSQKCQKLAVSDHF